ncbi:MAG: hypothetical protein ACYSTG_04635 [Planctomycetota bacterium]
MGRQEVAESGEDMYEIVEKILFGVGFIAIGGAVALMFFFMFAPSILGLKTIHKQLEKLQREAGQMNEQLKRIAGHLENENRQSKKRS